MAISNHVGPVRGPHLAERAPGYGIDGVLVYGNDRSPSMP